MDKKISQLASGTTPTGTEEIAVVQSGNTVKLTLNNVAGLSPTPTFQQTLTAGSTLTASNTILPSVSGSYDLIFGNNTSQFKTFRTDVSQYNEIFARKTATSSVSYFYNEGDEIDIGIDNSTNVNSLSITGFGQAASDGSLYNRFLLTDDIGLKGLTGAGYYGANYTDNTYVQKKWVTTNYTDSTTLASTYLTQSSAASTYLTQANASSTYLTIANAASTYQPLDADLTSWSAITRATGFDTFVATPSSANLAALLTDETGSGKVVFDTSPTFQTSVNAAFATASTIASFDGSKNLVSLATSTYPSLTELSYVKGVTSSIQTQIGTKIGIDDVYFTMTCSHINFSPSNATTYYIGVLYGSNPATSAQQRRITVPYNCVLIGAAINLFNNTVASNEASTVYLRLNNTTDVTLSNSVVFDTVGTTKTANYTVTGLSASISAGNTFEVKWVTPTWVTVPLNVTCNVVLFFKRA